jgi:hypothetical protein
VATAANCVDLVEIGLKGSSNPTASEFEIGERIGVGDAIILPNPIREVGGVFLSGAFRVIEQAVGNTAGDDVIRAGLDGEPIAMTKGVLEADVALKLRSG